MVDYRGRFVWYELMTSDVAAATAFYGKVLGWGVQDASMPGLAYTFFTVNNTFACGLMGFPEGVAQAGRAPQWIGYVAVDDVDACVDEVVRLGGTVHVPPRDVLNISRFSIVADPQGALFAVIMWFKPRRQPVGGMDEPGRVGWHELLAADGEVAFDFYHRLFNWSREDAGAGPLGRYHRLATGGQTIGGLCTKPAVLEAPSWLYYFNVRDIGAAAERVKANGGDLVEGPVEAPGGGGLVATCVDPGGGMFAIEGRRAHAVGYFASAAPPRPAKPKG